MKKLTVGTLIFFFSNPIINLFYLMPVRLRLLILFYRTKSTDINKEFQINFTTIKLNISFQFTALSLFQLTTQDQIRSAFKFLSFNIKKNMHKIENAIQNFLIITIVWV